MSLHSSAMSDHNTIAWLQERQAQLALRPADPTHVETMDNLLNDLVENLQYSSHTALLQTLLTAHDYLMLKGGLRAQLNNETTSLLLRAIEGLLLNHDIDDSISCILELLPADLHEENRSLLQKEASALASEFTEWNDETAHCQVNEHDTADNLYSADQSLAFTENIGVRENNHEPFASAPEQLKHSYISETNNPLLPSTDSNASDIWRSEVLPIDETAPTDVFGFHNNDTSLVEPSLHDESSSTVTPQQQSSVASYLSDLQLSPVISNGTENPSSFPLEDPDYAHEQATFVTTKLTTSHPLLLVIEMAQEDISALTEVVDSDWNTSLNLICEHLDNIAFTADSSGLDAFAILFRTQEEQLRQSVSDSNSLSTELHKLIPFLAAARSQAENEIKDNPVPESSPSSPDEEPLSHNLQHNTYTGSHSGYSDERLEVLAEELHEIGPELASLARSLIESEDNAFLKPLERYGDLMSRLISVCDALGMEGLKRVIIAITDNINLLPSLERHIRPLSLPLFLNWTSVVDRYLHNPADETAADTLIDFLQASEWPAPLSGLDSRDLFALLVEGPNEEQANDDQPQRPVEAKIEDISLSFDPDVNRDLFESFLIEAPELGKQFNSIITHLGEGPTLLDNLRAAQRISHTLKGSANLIGIKGIANLAHHTEDILEILARKRTTPPPALCEALARSGDCLEGMIDAVHGLDTPPDDSLQVLQLILDWANVTASGQLDNAPAPLLAHDRSHSGDNSQLSENSEGESPPPSPNEALSSVRVASTTIDDMFRLVEEITISQGQIREQAKRLKKLSDVLASHEQILQSKRFNLENLVDIRSIATMQRKAHRQRIARDEFDPLEMDQYDELHAATHSYIEAVADARELNQFVINNISQLDSLLLRQDRLNKELQQIVGATRLVPVSMITSRLERAVRQACRVTQKQATLEIVGRQFLIDGEVLNKLVDPLMHMLRNAVDHGIEHPDERLEAGKSPIGTITLIFRQEGNNIVVTCHDDGRGLDYSRITEVAVQKGLLQQAQNPSHEQLAQLILSPAFTTRNSATQLSGRGIGMDAVQAAVTSLKGTLSIEDHAGGGTEFIIRIPTSLVTNHSLIVRCGNDRFAIPTSHLQQILPPGSGRISLYGDTETFQLANAFYPLHSLNRLLNLVDDNDKENKTVLITASGGRTPAAIAVDYVLQSAELVVKGLGRYVTHVPGTIGVSVLGDGQVIPVLDLPQLISGAASNRTDNIIDGQVSTTSLDDSSTRLPEVLIVDDSLSVRNTLSQLLGDFGYRTQTARDGIEALEQIRKRAPSIVLTDLEMPRMDGMELARTLRGNPDTGQLPIVMITSRTQSKHRSAAEQAGINAYVTKPFIDEELLDTLSTLIESHAQY